MNKPHLVPATPNSKTAETRQQIEEVLQRTRRTMVRQELLKRLWQLEANRNSKRSS